MESRWDSRRAELNGGEMWSSEIQRLRASLHLLQHFDAEGVEALLQRAGGHVAPREAGSAVVFQSPRDCIPQPRVATQELPWVNVVITKQL